MASKITELKNIVTEQNQWITTMKDRDNKTRSQLRSVYQLAVTFKDKYISEATTVETSAEYPGVRMEDMSQLQVPDLIRNLGLALRASANSLMENRTELHAIYHELNLEVDSAMEAWNTIKAQEDREAKQDAFRQGLLSQNTLSRAKTPDLPESPETPAVRGVSDPLTPPHTADKGEKREAETGQSKSGTETLANLLKSPITPSPKTTKQQPVQKGKTNGHAKN